MTDSTEVAAGAFVISLPRTGSTLVRLLIDTHPEIWAPDELELGALARALFHTTEGLTESAGRARADDPDWGQSPEASSLTRRVLDELFAERLRLRGKRLWCEKSPRNLEHLEILDHLYPRASWIALHRHPLDTLASWLDSCRYGILFDALWEDVTHSPKNFLAAMLRSWRDQTRRLLAHEHRSGERCLRLRYEDLVADPGAQAARIFAFLGVEMPAGIEREVFAAEHHQRASYGGDLNALLASGITTRRAGRGNALPWHKVKALPEALRTAVDGLATELGYPPIDFAAGRFTVGVELVDSEDPARGEIPLALLFERVAQTWVPEAVDDPGHGLALEVAGAGGGAWSLGLGTAPATLRDGVGDLTQGVAIAAEDLRALISGRSNAGVLFRDGKIRVHGDVDLALVRRLLARLIAVAGEMRP